MEFFTPLPPGSASSLGMALVMASTAPLVLLSEDLVVTAASRSFCNAFALDCASVVGTEFFALGAGEWDTPQLRSLLRATASGQAAIDAYEFDLKRPGHEPRCLMLDAHIVEHAGSDVLKIVLAITDVTDARQVARDKDALARDKLLLHKELHHRVANSLQIIASVLMQRVRSVQSEETRTHLRDAHHRVMSVATLQRQLASTAMGQVAMRPYLTELCASIGASMIADPTLLTLTVTADDLEASPDNSVSMGLIVTELVINSLKHAYPGEVAKGAITVDCHATPEGWVLTVADDGIGMGGTNDSAKPGLGTGIINALAEQLKATVTVSASNPGTVVTIANG